eukprot:gene24888-biopygen17954
MAPTVVNKKLYFEFPPADLLEHLARGNMCFGGWREMMASPPPSPVSAAPHPCGATVWVRGAVGAAGSPPLGRTSSGGAVYWNGKCPLGAAYWNEMALWHAEDVIFEAFLEHFLKHFWSILQHFWSILDAKPRRNRLRPRVKQTDIRAPAGNGSHGWHPQLCTKNCIFSFHRRTS